MYLSCWCVLCVLVVFCFFFFKQKTAYEMRISDWSSDVCSSDLRRRRSISTLAVCASSTSAPSAKRWVSKKRPEISQSGVPSGKTGCTAPRPAAAPLRCCAASSAASHRGGGTSSSSMKEPRHQQRKRVVAGKEGTDRVIYSGTRY